MRFDQRSNIAIIKFPRGEKKDNSAEKLFLKN